MRRFFDLRSPVADYISVPKSYVILQRINLGLFAVLGELSATANWRAISEEIWPFTHGPASTPMGRSRGRMAGTAPGDRGVTGLSPQRRQSTGALCRPGRGLADRRGPLVSDEQKLHDCL